jgi:hypothetical protein
MPTNDLSPHTVLALVESRMWADDTDDLSRFVLEHAYHSMRSLMCRVGRVSKSLEVAEAERETFRRICYGSQKGGSA